MPLSKSSQAVIAAALIYQVRGTCRAADLKNRIAYGVVVLRQLSCHTPYQDSMALL